MIEQNNIILKQKNETLRTCQVRPAGYTFEYIHFSIISSALQILIDNYNDRLVSKREFVKQFLAIHPFLDGNSRTVKILIS